MADCNIFKIIFCPFSCFECVLTLALANRVYCFFFFLIECEPQHRIKETHNEVLHYHNINSNASKWLYDAKHA